MLHLRKEKQHDFEPKEGKDMKVLTVLGALILSTPALAWDYSVDTYPGYGYASPSVTLDIHELKTGATGTEPLTHKNNLYYPGFMAGNPTKIAQGWGGR
jgi:hypothetical protein